MTELLDEYAYLIHLIKCALGDEQPREIPAGMSFESVFQCGADHDVANIAFYSVKKLKKKPDEQLYRQWEDCCHRTVVRDFNQSYSRDEIVEEFQNANIRCLEIQGTWIKKLYPQPEFRTMSDIDFIIDSENLPKAGRMLERLGYQCKGVAGVDIFAFRPPNINVEIHTDYFHRSSRYHCVMRPPFSSVDETGEYSINEFYIYNILHIAKHYFGGGCGIRRVLDAYFLNLNYGERIDKQYVNSFFRAAKVEKFVAELSALAERWFALGESSGKYSDMERYIFRSRVHGTMNNWMRNRVRFFYRDNSRFYKLKYCLRRLFPGKKNMYLRYPVLKKWKILYPFCWLHRVFKGFGSARVKKEVEIVMDENTLDQLK
ncbi:MAG: nucleotidyltransferase family protein [Oscillospiraceae bacterium]|nr:nucleotidyltransferase family protein [Oscillospiraceae bacterium]